MSRRRLLSVIGAVVGSTGLAMLVPVIAALIYREYGDALQIGLAGVVTVAAGAHRLAIREIRRTVRNSPHEKVSSSSA